MGIETAVVNGNSKYYIKLENIENVFVADISFWNKLPFIKEGDTISIEYYTDANGKITVTAVK